MYDFPYNFFKEKFWASKHDKKPENKTKDEDIIYLKSKNNTMIPTIVVDPKIDGKLKSHVPISVDEFKQSMVKKGYKLADPDALEIKPMGDIGNGLFAKKDIIIEDGKGYGPVVAIHGGRVHGANGYRTNRYDIKCGKSNICNTVIRRIHPRFADQIQHAFPVEVIKSHLEKYNVEANNGLVGPNAVAVGIDTKFSFCVVVLVLIKSVEAGDIILSDYGNNYVFDKGKMDSLIVFNTKGKSLYKFDIDYDKRDLILSKKEVIKHRLTDLTNKDNLYKCHKWKIDKQDNCIKYMARLKVDEVKKLKTFLEERGVIVECIESRPLRGKPPGQLLTISINKFAMEETIEKQPKSWCMIF